MALSVTRCGASVESMGTRYPCSRVRGAIIHSNRKALIPSVVFDAERATAIGG